MKTQQPVLTTSVLAAADLPRHRFAGFNGNLCGAGERALGTVEADTEADNMAPVNVLGILLVEAGGAVTAGSAVQSDASGKAIAIAEGKIANGIAIDAATADGDVIRIIRGI